MTVTYLDGFFTNGVFRSGPWTQQQINADTQFFEKIAEQIHATTSAAWRAYMGSLNLVNELHAFDKIIEIFETEIKEDTRVAKLVYLTGMSAYSLNPQNLGLQAPTSEGKTYVVVTVLKHFPKEDVWYLGKLSPMALVHQYSGTRIDLEGNDLAPRYGELTTKLHNLENIPAKDRGEHTQKDLDETRKSLDELRQMERNLIDMRGKILVFFEPPHSETWSMIKPLLSHDKWEIEYRIVEKGKDGKWTTKLTLLRGWPAVIYCSAKDQKDPYWDEIASRFITTSPTMTKTKYSAGIAQVADKNCLPGVIFQNKIRADDHKRISEYIERVRNRWFEQLRLDATEPDNIFWNPYKDVIAQCFPAEVGRNMRDAKRFITTMNASAFSMPFHRPMLNLGKHQFIIVVREDFERALDLFFNDISAGTIFTGIPNHILDFFSRVVVPLCKASTNASFVPTEQEAENLTDNYGGRTTVEKMRLKYTQVFGKTKSADTIRKSYLETLQSHGYVDSEQNPADKRSYFWFVLSDEGKSGFLTKLQDSASFTFKTLEEAQTEFQQITGEPPEYVGPDGSKLTLDELWDRYFAVSPIDAGATAVIDSPANQNNNGQIDEKKAESANFGIVPAFTERGSAA